MKIENEQQLDLLLTQFLDGALSESERKEIESFVQMDISAQKKLEELKRLKELLGAKQKLTPDVGFWTRFSIVMDEQQKEEYSMLPFSRKYIPAMATTLAALCLVVGAVIIQNRMQIIQYYSDKTHAVKEAYEKNILHGQLLPLFTNVDKDQALQFSLLGTLPLDDKSNTELRVDEQSEKGYRIEVGKDSKKKTKQVTFNHFLATVKPTDDQKRLIDSMLELTGHRIESSVLLGENNAMAIAPDLPKLNKMMVTNIASCLEPAQRVQFEHFLEANNAPYSVTSSSGMPIRREERILQRIPRSPRGDQFVLITPDTMMYTQIHINLDSLHRQLQENMIAVELRREAMLKRIIARDFQRASRNVTLSPQVQSFGDEEFLSVDVQVPSEENEPQQVHIIIRPRVRKQNLETGAPQNPIQIRTGNDTITDPVAP